MIRGPIAVICLVLASLAVATGARADTRVDELDRTLSTSSSDKTRLAAVAALAKIGDKSALKPLVKALHDPNADVRATAVVALGHLGHKAALPSLRDLAANDPDDTVRAKARTAAKLVARANHIADDGSEVASEDADGKPEARTSARATHAAAPHPDVYVVVKTTTDDSPGTTDKDTRKVHADVIRQAFVDECHNHASVTLTAGDAQQWGLSTHQVDVSVVKLEGHTVGGNIEVEATLRLAISDDKGKMQSFLTGGAKVSVPKVRFNTSYLPQLRQEALENAMRGMFDKLLAHLRKTQA